MRVKKLRDWPFKKASHVERLHEFVIKNYCQLASGNFPSFPHPPPTASAKPEGKTWGLRECRFDLGVGV